MKNALWNIHFNNLKFEYGIPSKFWLQILLPLEESSLFVSILMFY